MVYSKTYMSGFLNTVLKPFFLARDSKGDNIKIKRKISPCFSFSTRLSSFHCRPLSIFALFHGLKAASRSGEIKVKYG